MTQNLYYSVKKFGVTNIFLWCKFGAIVQQKAPITCQLRER